MLKKFAEGSTILVDKPYEWTSFDVVNKIRWHLKRKLGVKKIKVGHAGTLDPLATGLLIICIGKHTKNIEGLMSGQKTYTGTFLLGKTTPSYDLETQFDSESDPGEILDEQLYEVASTFLGEIDQMPPIFSAKKIDGKRAYDLARAGKDVDIKSNKVIIEKLNVSSSKFPEVEFEIVCSKGTYIRSVANDFGQKLGVGATLTTLRRTRSGDLDVKNAHSVDYWIDFIESSSL